MSNIITKRGTIKPQAKRVAAKLKSQILSEILLPNASVPAIAKKYNLSRTTLYGWRSNYNKKHIISINNRNNNDSNEDNSNNNQEIPESNFIELVSEEGSGNNSLPKIPSSFYSPKPKNTKLLSEISLIFNNNISLSLKGNINTSSLIKILGALEEESC